MFISGPSPCSGGVKAESWGYCSSIYVHRVLASNLQHDVTDAEATKSVVRKAVKQFGRLDVAFANAGISWRAAPATLRTYDEDEFERICAVDLNPQPTSVCRDGQQSPRRSHHQSAARFNRQRHCEHNESSPHVSNIMTEAQRWTVKCQDPADGSGDVIVDLPPELLASLGLSVGDVLTIEVIDGAIVLTPKSSHSATP